jgi:hypothetical protein
MPQSFAPSFADEPQMIEPQPQIELMVNSYFTAFLANSLS